MNRKQPKPPQTEPIIIKRNPGFFIIKNEVATEYLPIITTYGYSLYGIYAAIANRDAGNRWFISIPTLERFSFINQDTIIKYNWLLEACKMLNIKSGVDGFANEYTVLEPEPITPEILESIAVELKRPVEGQGKNWQTFKANALDRLRKWQKLSDCSKKGQSTRILSKIDPTKQPELFSTNGNGHHAAPALPSQPELTAMLMKYFEPEKLTEAAAIKMITDYGVEAVLQQYVWLENRETDTPLRTLRAALKGKWLEPKAVGKPEPKEWWDDGAHEKDEYGQVRPKRQVMQDEINLV